MTSTPSPTAPVARSPSLPTPSPTAPVAHSPSLPTPSSPGSTPTVIGAVHKNPLDSSPDKVLANAIVPAAPKVPEKSEASVVLSP